VEKSCDQLVISGFALTGGLKVPQILAVERPAGGQGRRRRSRASVSLPSEKTTLRERVYCPFRGPGPGVRDFGRYEIKGGGHKPHASRQLGNGGKKRLGGIEKKHIGAIRAIMKLDIVSGKTKE